MNGRHKNSFLMNNKLFVYGSLLGDIHSNIALFLRRNSRFLGEYRARGRMYDLGAYPGLVLTAEEDHWVFGHVFQLFDPASTLITLDDYEGIIPGKENENEYRRELVEVSREETTEHAWAYLYQQSTADLPLIPFGNYLDYLKQNDAHQKFIQSH